MKNRMLKKGTVSAAPKETGTPANRGINKKRLLTGLLMFTLLFTLYSCKKRELKNYNVVLVVIDTLRSDHLPCCGYKKNTAPFISQLAEKSALFENTFSASSWTSPATASIFTSLYPFQHKLLMGLLAIRMAKQIDPNLKINKIPDEATTITEVLKKAGYHTVGISDNLNIGDKQGFTQGFDKFATYMYETAANVNATLKKWQDEITGKGKYFLYIHYMDPHAPYHRRDPLYEKKEDRQEDLISAYDSEIHYVDRHFKEMFDLFKWEKNTLLIVTADHGEGLWDHGRMGHGNTLYREELQVPLLVYFPGGTVAKRLTALTSTIDILPTVRDVIGLPPDKNNEGMSLVPLIEGSEKAFEERHLFPYLWKKVKTEIEFRSTLYDKWHFIVRMPKKKELYNLIGDKLETHNHFFKGFKIAAGLEKKFNEFFKDCKKFKEKKTDFKLDREKMDKLKSLGYVEDTE